MYGEPLVPKEDAGKATKILIAITVGCLALCVAATIILTIALKPSKTVDVVTTDKAPKPIGPYNVAKKYGGMVYLSGQIGLNPQTQTIAADVQTQTQQIMDNIRNILEAAGSSLDKVVRCNVFLTNISDFATVNTVYAEYFKNMDQPARSAVAVVALPRPYAKVYIEAIAALS